MKKKFSKIWGVGLAVVVIASMLLIAAPASAALPNINEWDELVYHSGTNPAGKYFRDASITGVGPMAEAIDGTLHTYVAGLDDMFWSTDAGRTWATSTATTGQYAGGAVVDIACSSIDADDLYVTDGNYVYKSVNAGSTWTKVAAASLEGALTGLCGCTIDDTPITSLDVGYDASDKPYLFIGNKAVANNGCMTKDLVASVYWIAEEGFPSAWTDLTLSCYDLGGFTPYSIGCEPNFATTKKTNVVVTKPITLGFALDTAAVITVTAGNNATTFTYSALPGDVTCAAGASPVTLAAGASTTFTADATHVAGDVVIAATSGSLSLALTTGTATITGGTYVVSTIGTTCSWTTVAELKRNCVDKLVITAASRIGYPDDYADVKTLLVGVVGSPTDSAFGGGDVYSVTYPSAIDLNVSTVAASGCVGIDADIISLDVCGDTDEASVLAGSYDDANVYYSSDGGWTWAASVKDPTGDGTTYVLWVGDCGVSALAATAGCECALSLSCGDVVGKYWNQISLIDTCVDCVIDLSHSAGYIINSQLMYMLTRCDNACTELDTYSLWRHDGTYWERVFMSKSTSAVVKWVMASPQSDETEVVYLANGAFDMWRSLDAGCTWAKLRYPCQPGAPTISAWTVVDSETVIAGGYGSYAGKVYKTTRHGTRPWKSYTWDSSAAGGANNFDVMGDNVLLGDSKSAVFYSDDLALTWHQVDNAPIDAGADAGTWVEFDPGFATSGDAGENMVYGAADDTIARCVIDTSLAWTLQTWYAIDAHTGTFTGIAAIGDTALYVLDTDANGGMLRTLNPTAKVASIEWERVTTGLTTGDKLEGYDLLLTAGENGCPDSNVLWAREYDPDCAVVWFYEDTLATPAILNSPAAAAKLTTTTTATLGWDAFCDDDATVKYQIAIWSQCATCPGKTYVAGYSLTSFTCELCGSTTAACVGCSDVDCCKNVTGLVAGTEYSWKVRACAGYPTLSKWSAERTFTTAMGGVLSLCSPVCGAEDIITGPNFSWSKVTGATGYEVEIVAASADGTADWTTAVSGTSDVNAWAGAPELDFSTTYYWRVRAEKDSVVGAWTTCIFTTEAAPPAPPADVWVCPQCGLTFSSAAALEAHIADAHAPPAPAETPAYIWVIIAIGALLAIAVIILIVRTRRVV